MQSRDKRLIFEMSKKGRRTPIIGDAPDGWSDGIPNHILRDDELPLPYVSEPEVIRHYTGLSAMNYGVDTGSYPLGSCTMKYNPKINEDVAALKGFTSIHPLQDDASVHGALRVYGEMEEYLCAITGMEAFTFQPSAGAHGEMTGLMMMAAYLRDMGEHDRDEIIIPDSAHGTNPASAAMAGFKVVEVKSDDRGNVDMDALRAEVSDKTAGIMLTNPNTLGLFEENIVEIASIIHGVGGLLYYDGANLNAVMGKVRPGDMGFDVIHLNLHKTFSTPHGGGGPGAGPVGVVKRLVPYLPKPTMKKSDNGYAWDYNRPKSIGRIKAFNGNFSVILKAYAYILTMGAVGISRASSMAVLNANYLQSKLKHILPAAVDRICMHEFVLSALKLKDKGISAIDVAKSLIDYGFHPPTIYFPLIVKEAIMIEPTETESIEALDALADAVIDIVNKADTKADELRNAPITTPVGRLDEVMASRKPKLIWKARENQ